MNKRLVIKIGSDTITSDNGLNYKRINSLANDVSKLHNDGYEILVVSSGAISSGLKHIGETNGPNSLARKRALAAIGQGYLMEAWIKAFHPTLVAQALLTWKELADNESKQKAKETIEELLKEKVIPIINENDTVADEEIRFSDNDQLALKLAKLVNADRLILLTDVDGLHSSDPKTDESSNLIDRVEKIDNKIKAMVNKTKSENGKGGMLSKILVAEEAMGNGITTNILNGKKDGAILSLIKEGINLGTEFSI